MHTGMINRYSDRWGLWQNRGTAASLHNFMVIFISASRKMRVAETTCFQRAAGCSLRHTQVKAWLLRASAKQSEWNAVGVIGLHDILCDNLLRTRPVKVDVKFVAFGTPNRAVPKLLMKDPLALSKC